MTDFAAAPVGLDLAFRFSRNHHNPMEPHATIARWEGEHLTVWDKTQWVVGGTQQELASIFGIPQRSVRVISPFVGGVRHRPPARLHLRAETGQ